MNCKLLSVLLSAVAVTMAIPACAQEAAPTAKTPPVVVDKQVGSEAAGLVPAAGVPAARGAVPGVTVQDPRAPQPAGDAGNAWFPVTTQNLGTYFNHEIAKGSFSFKNPKDSAQVWRHLDGSCQCAKALIRVGDRVYELTKGAKGAGGSPLQRIEETANGVKRTPVTQIEVGPLEAGEVEVHMEMNGVSGTRMASLDIHTDDADTPMVKLKFTATGAQMFVLSPNEVNLNEMVWNEKREFTVSVTSPISKDFNITKLEDPGEEFDVTYDKELKDGVATWTIHGTYAPKSGEALGGGLLRFQTDAKGQASFMVRVSAMVQGPLDVKPGTFLTMGMIRRGEAKAASVTFVPNDGSDLKAEAISFERLSVDPKFVTARQSKDGKNLVIEIQVSPEAPKGLLRGDMIVKLNHPAIESKKVLFNGYVR